jgi:TPR repeat protein
MRAKHNWSNWLAIFAMAALPSVALAEAATPAPATAEEAAKIEAAAEKAYDAEDIDIAIPLFIKAAEMNNLRAQVYLGELAEASQVYEAAVGWYLTAAMQGDPPAQYALGKMYIAGTGIEKDDAKALYWIKRSADKKHLPAVKVMADAYRVGLLGLQVDPDQAAAWQAKAVRLEEIQRREADAKLKAFIAEQQKMREEAAAKKAPK